MSRRLLMAVVVIGVCGWALARQEKPDAKTDAKTELMDADRAFAKVTAEKGIDGWMSFMTDDAVRVAPLGGKAHVGKDAVRKLDAALFFADPKQKLVWEPTDGGAFADGKHGYTTGRSQMLAKNDKGEEEVRWTGAYVTWWRKGTDGWKVILDTGAADPPKKP